MRRKLGFFAKLAFIAIVFFLVISIVDKNISINQMKKDQLSLETSREEYQLKVEKLEAELKEEKTEETIKRIAKRKLNLREPGNIVYASDLPN